MRVIFCYYSYIYISYPSLFYSPKKECSMPSLSIQHGDNIYPIYLVAPATHQVVQRYPSRYWPMPFPYSSFSPPSSFADDRRGVLSALPACFRTPRTRLFSSLDTVRSGLLIRRLSRLLCCNRSCLSSAFFMPFSSICENGLNMSIAFFFRLAFRLPSNAPETCSKSVFVKA